MKHLLKRYGIFFLIAITSIVLDQYTKYLIQQNIALNDVINIWWIFGISHVHNTGAAWGIFHNSTSILSIFSIAVGVFLLIAFLFSHKMKELDNMAFTIAVSLIFGGTIGNWIDRQFVGYVTDFIHVGTFPNFNIADSCIVCGSILLAIILIFFSNDNKKETEDNNSTDKLN